MADPKDDKGDVKIAISEHLHLHGPKKWDMLLAKFPTVSRATVFRWIKEVREDIERGAAERPGADLKLVQKRIRARVSTPEQNERELKANLPVAPSPAMIVGLGSDVDEVFSFMAHFNGLLADADMLRQKAIKVDAEGKEVLVNPNLLDKSIGRRLGLLETWIRSQDLVWNYERMQELHSLILDEVGKAAPEIQMAILSRIRTLNNRRGLTINARLS